MSIILNALRQQPEKPEGASGVLWSQKAARKSWSIPWRAVIIGIAVFSLGFSSIMFTSSWIRTKIVSPLPAPLPLPQAPAQVKPEILAQQAFERGDFMASIPHFHAAVKENPNDWALLNNLGLALTKISKLDEAESAFFKAIAINTGCGACYNNLGDLEVKRNALDEAELYYRKASKADPADAAPYFNLGVLYEKKGDPDAAFEAYGQFLERTSNLASPIAKKVQARLKNLEIEE